MTRATDAGTNQRQSNVVPGTEQIIAAALVITALSVIIASGIKVYKVAHRIDAALGVDKEGRTLSDRMARVEHQLWPNGGSSLADKMNRVEKAQTETQVEVRVVRDMLTILVEKP